MKLALAIALSPPLAAQATVFTGATGLTDTSFSNVVFQYGTGLTDPSFPGGNCPDCGPGQQNELPEPSTAALIGLGFLASLVAARRGSQKPA